MSLERPWCCPEHKCQPVHQIGIKGPDLPGCSWHCLGRMPQAVAFAYDGVSHTNDLNTCVFTPLKGLIRFQENADDWFLMAHLYATGLWKLAGKPPELRPERPWKLRKAVDGSEDVPTESGG